MTVYIVRLIVGWLRRERLSPSKSVAIAEFGNPKAAPHAAVRDDSDLEERRKQYTTVSDPSNYGRSDIPPLKAGGDEFCKHWAEGVAEADLASSVTMTEVKEFDLNSPLTNN